jgi:fermentation-respiration switch protein FrsA (DUF1100 family)
MGEKMPENLIAKSKAQRKSSPKPGGDYVMPPAIKTTRCYVGPFDYYLNSKRGAIKEWGNQFAVMAWKGWLEFDAITTAEKINIPVQIIHSKTAAVPNGAESYYSKLPSTKNIIWIDNATQFDFYDGETLTTKATLEAVKWFEKHLN